MQGLPFGAEHVSAKALAACGDPSSGRAPSGGPGRMTSIKPATPGQHGPSVRTLTWDKSTAAGVRGARPRSARLHPLLRDGATGHRRPAPRRSAARLLPQPDRCRPLARNGDELIPQAPQPHPPTSRPRPRGFGDGIAGRRLRDPRHRRMRAAGLRGQQLLQEHERLRRTCGALSVVRPDAKQAGASAGPA